MPISSPMTAPDGSSGPHASATILTVDLAAIAANYRSLRARLQGAACAGVVKADGYGLGAARIAPALAAAGCRDFFVAHLGEGLGIRRGLAAGEAIYVLNGVLAGEDSEFAARDLIPVLNDLAQVEAWTAAARRHGRRLPAVLHIDTGMSRLGLAPADAQRLAADPRRLDGIDLRYVMSHLACAEETGNPKNSAQLRLFAAERARWPAVKASFANSSGIFLGGDYHFDLVRPGCALYGINPTPDRPNPVAQTAALHARILQVREIDPPETVGYGATHRVTTRTRIATVAAGYADGWLRTLSNRGCAYYGDIRVPIVGRVSMDLITLDVTAAPAARAGETVELMGPHLPVDAVAELAKTNGYEVLTRLGDRFHRVYTNGAAAA